MTMILVPIIVVGIIAITIAVYAVNQYNKIVKLRNAVHISWKQIDVQLRHYHNLIPDFVTIVNDYTEHKTLNFIIKTRSGLISGSPQQRIKTNNQIQETLTSVFALSESHPALQINKNFVRLRGELLTTENNIAYSRQLCNKQITAYNTKRELFLMNVITLMLKFTHEKPLPAPEKDKYKGAGVNAEPNTNAR